MTAVARYFALLLMLVILGCKRSTTDTKSYDESIFVEGETDWMDLDYLRIIGEEHLRSNIPISIQKELKLPPASTGPPQRI